MFFITHLGKIIFGISGCVVYAVCASSFIMFVLEPYLARRTAVFSDDLVHMMCSTIMCSPEPFKVYGPQLIIALESIPEMGLPRQIPIPKQNGCVRIISNHIHGFLLRNQGLFLL